MSYIQAIIWISLENILLKERVQTQNNCLSPLLCDISKRQVYRHRKSIGDFLWLGERELQGGGLMNLEFP